MPRLSAEDAARRCASELETVKETWETGRAKSENKLAMRLSRGGDSTRLSAFMLALWGVEYDRQAKGLPQDEILDVLAEFDRWQLDKVFATNKPDGSNGSTTRLYSFGEAAYRTLPKDGRHETVMYGERTLRSAARFRVSVNQNDVWGKVIVPTYSVLAPLFSKSEHLEQPVQDDFTALTVVRSIGAHEPHTVRTSPVLWNQEILSGVNRLRDFQVAANSLLRAQQAFNQTPGYN